MSPALVDWVDHLANVPVVVLGEAMLDTYLHGAAERLSREAPVPIVSVVTREDAPGGAANTAVNVATLGGVPRFVSVVGDDADGVALSAALAGCGVPTDDLLVAPGRMTLAKERVLASEHMLVRVDRGTLTPLTAADEDGVIDRLHGAADGAAAIIVSDYDYGLLSERVRAALVDLRRSRRIPLVVDSRELRRYRRVGPTAVKPNYAEAVRLLGDTDHRDPRQRALQIGSSGERLLSLTGARVAIVTMDTDGAFVFERAAAPYRLYSRPRPHQRSAGAGDTFVAAFTLALAVGAPPSVAAELASAAAAVVVGKAGTSSCSPAELRQSLGAPGKRLAGADDLAAQVAWHRGQGRRIVFTNGCFDLLHPGHVTYLNRAKGLGDVLIVAVNSDESTRRLKGPTRPINPLDDRVAVLEALSCVDHVVAFEADTPAELIVAARPDVFVKGGDYHRDSLPEAALVESLGGAVQILPFLEDRSTSGIIARVRSTAPLAG